MGKITTNPGEKKPPEPEVQVEPTAPLPQKVAATPATELPLPVTMTTAPPRRKRRCCILLLSVLIVVMVGISITLGALYLCKNRGRDHDKNDHWEGENDGDWDELMGGGGGHRPYPDGDRPYPHRPGGHRPGGHHSGEHRPGHDSSSSEEHGWRPRPPHGGHRPYPPRPRPSGEPRPPRTRPSGEPQPPIEP